MYYQYVPYLWITILLSFISVSLIIYTWKNRTVLGARYFLLTIIMVELWIAAQGLEMAALDLPKKIFWANIQYIPIMLTPLSYFYLTLQFTRSDIWLQRRWVRILLLIAPITINVLLWTKFSYLIRQNVSLDTSGAFPIISKTYGPLFWVFASFNYLITILTFINLLISLKEKAPIYRKQILFLITALFFPVISNLLHIMGMNPFRIDTTPAFFGLSAMMISLGIFRYRLFDIIPIAHSIIIHKMRIGMIVLDNEGRMLDINPAAEKMMNLSSKNLIGHSIEVELSGFPELLRICREDRETVCEIDLNDIGTHFYYEVSLTKIKNSDNQPIGQLLQFYDITERKIAEKLIQHAAHHDSLTGLTNRYHFQVIFSKALNHAKSSHSMLTVAYLDLDDFKQINDTHGHDVGDKLLCEIAKRLKKILRDTDIVARVGGDEFAIVLPEIGEDEQIRSIGELLSKEMEKIIELSAGTVKIKASIGFCVYPRDGDNTEELLKKADKAMYMAKDSDVKNYFIYRE